MTQKPQTYADVSVIVDGALDQSEVFTDYLLLNQFIEGVREEAEGDGYPTEVFIQYHEHELTDGECECAQYETDHHPDFAWNVGEPKS